MSIISFLVHVAIYGLLLLLDIAILFVVIRLICSWRRVRFLVGFDAVGRELVAGLSRDVERLWHRLRPSSVLVEREQLLLTLAAVSIARCMVAAVSAAML